MQKEFCQERKTLILIESSFAALSSLTRNISLELSLYELVSTHSKVSKILNWHESTKTINNGIPLTCIIDVTFKESETFTFVVLTQSQPLLVLRAPYTFSPIPPSGYPSFFNGEPRRAFLKTGC